MGVFWFRNFSGDFQSFWVFAFCHRTYSKTRKPRKILIRSFLKVLRLSIFEHFSKHFVRWGRNSQSVAQIHQSELNIEAWKWLFLLLKPKWNLDNKLVAFSNFLVMATVRDECFFYLRSLLWISGISGFSLFAIEHIRKPGIHGKFS